MRNAGLEEAQAWIKIARRNINNLIYADDTTLMVESEEELKSFLMKVKEGGGESWLKAQHSENKIMASGPITSWQIDGETVEKVADFIFWAPKSLQMVITAIKLKDAYSLEGKLWPTQIAYSKAKTLFAEKGSSNQNYVFSSSRVWMWELDYKEGWAQNWCFRTVALEKTLESPLDCKIKLVHPWGNQSWAFIRRTVVEAETPIFWPPDVKSLLIWKDPDFGKEWRQEEEGTTEDEIVRWHHRLNGHDFG